jgi:hypothetical protein
MYVSYPYPSSNNGPGGPPRRRRAAGDDGVVSQQQWQVTGGISYSYTRPAISGWSVCKYVLVFLAIGPLVATTGASGKPLGSPCGADSGRRLTCTYTWSLGVIETWAPEMEPDVCVFIFNRCSWAGQRRVPSSYKCISNLQPKPVPTYLQHAITRFCYFFFSLFFSCLCPLLTLAVGAEREALGWNQDHY